MVDLHNGNIPMGCIPVIVMDCWEHAYYRDYLTDRKSYVFAMMREINWTKVHARFEKAEKAAKVLS
jgi:Fe-Mn family superoxide dismutase